MPAGLLSFVLVQFPVFGDIRLAKFPRTHRRTELPAIEGAVVIAIERVEARAGCFFHFVQAKRTVMIGIPLPNECIGGDASGWRRQRQDEADERQGGNAEP